ncbi:MAG: hypothetical protein ACI8YQ_003071 [Polaribacter sp.]
MGETKLLEEKKKEVLWQLAWTLNKNEDTKSAIETLMKISDPNPGFKE